MWLGHHLVDDEGLHDDEEIDREDMPQNETLQNSSDNDIILCSDDDKLEDAINSKRRKGEATIGQHANGIFVMSMYFFTLILFLKCLIFNFDINFTSFFLMHITKKHQWMLRNIMIVKPISEYKNIDDDEVLMPSSVDEEGLFFL